MSDFLDKFNATLEKVVVGGTDQTTKDAVTALTAQITGMATDLAANDADDAANKQILADHETAITALVNKLAGVSTDSGSTSGNAA